MTTLLINLGAAAWGNIPVTRSVNRDPIAAQTNPPLFPTSSALIDFIHTVQNGNPGSLVGIYSPQLFTLPVVQQPVDDTTYVSDTPGVVTQFGMASQFGGVGMLAHNTLAGANFSRLGLNQLIALVYGDGTLRLFRVAAIRTFQALDPGNAYSNFIDQENPGEILSAGQVFIEIYGHANQVVLQTCMQKDGDFSWGRLFVIAKPVTGTPSIN